MINGKTFQLKSQIILDGDESDGIIVIDGHSGTMVSCNDSAAQLCAKLQEGAAAGELVRFLVSTYEVSEAAAERDVVRFLDRLGAMGLIDERA
jgi:hypothetical protein